MANVKRNAKNEVVTKEILKDFFEDIKDFVKSTAKGTENTLRKEIKITQLAVTEHTKMIRRVEGEVQGLKTEMQGVKGEVQGLKTEMHQIEKRLSDKIDKIAVSVESHETRLTVVEEKIESHLAVHP